MDIENEKAGVWARGKGCLLSSINKAVGNVGDVGRRMKKLGQDDPRRVVHSLKVGMALTLVSLFYYFQPTYDSFGVSAMWAVMTVVVVFEFSVGATLGKGINRGLATLVAGALGIGAHHLANLSGHIGEPIVLALFVFLQAAATSFVRFVPEIKARYDYGLLIFILTFSLVSVSGFRDDEILELAHRRLATIAIGCCACVIVSVAVCPVWAGQELHDNIATNMQKLATFLEGFGSEYIIKKSGRGEMKVNDDGGASFREGYKSVLNSKPNEEALANFARWEPGHGRFKFKHPWQQYLKIGSLCRQCAYTIEALNAYLTSNYEHVSPEMIRKILDVCTEISSESGKALKELETAVKTMTQPSPATAHICNSKAAAKKLESMLRSDLYHSGDLLLSVVPALTVGSLLTDVVSCTEKIADSVRDLASLAHFKPCKTVQPPGSPDTNKSNRFLNDAVQCASNKAAATNCPSAAVNAVRTAALEAGEVPPMVTRQHIL